ncbi:hypothetical protein SBV1_560012 [Verrucomicrobia bacterium]|nr:hypothetical protein SBV1_560012 [Verrucomicrobiota bacterium]
MRSEENDIRSQRSCGRFFGSLVALSAGLACLNIYHGRWGMALELVPGLVFFSGLAWWALSGTALDHGPDPEQGSGTSGAGKPVPVGPNPTHHLVAAKDLPPSDKTHSFPHD